MMNPGMPRDHGLECEVHLPVPARCFASPCDEAAFFDWLSKLSRVVTCRREGDALWVAVAMDRVDETAMRELVALFHRYGIDMRPLLTFDRVKLLGRALPGAGSELIGPRSGRPAASLSRAASQSVLRSSWPA